MIFSRHPKLAAVSLGVVLFSSWATTIYISVWLQYKARIQEPFEMFDTLYDKPWARIGPYLIGKSEKRIEAGKFNQTLFYEKKEWYKDLISADSHLQ